MLSKDITHCQMSSFLVENALDPASDKLLGMTEAFAFWYVRPDGSFEVTCSQTCFNLWCESGLVRGRATRWPAGAYPITFESLCVTCRACGTLVHTPKSCLVHGNECPPWSWLLSYRAVEFADSIAQLGDITPENWRVAGHIATIHPELTGEEIAAEVARR